MSQILSSTLKTLEQIGRERKIPNISEQNAEYLKNLIRERQPKHILEIGTANGYSTLCFSGAILQYESIQENPQKQEFRDGADFSK